MVLKLSIKKFVLLSGVILLFLSFASSLRAESLAEAIGKAYQRIPSIKSKQSVVSAASYAIDSAASNHRPQVSFGAVSTVGEYDNTSTRNREHQGAVSNNSNNSNLLVRQRLFDDKLTSSQVNVAESLHAQSKAELAALEEEIAGYVSLAYLDVLRFRELVSLAEQNIADGKQMLEIIHKQVDKGYTATVDVHLAATRVSAAESQLMIQQESLQDAEIRYQSLVGSLPTNLIMPVQPPVPGSLDDAMIQYLPSHPAVIAAGEAVNAARFTVRARRSAWMPQVDLELFASKGEDIEANLGTDDKYGANLALNWSLYTGGRNLAEFKRSQEELTAATSSLDETRRTVKESIEQAWNRLRSVESRLNLLQEQAIADEKVYQAYKSLLKAAKRSPLDVMVVLSSQNQSRLAAKDSEYQVLIRKYQLFSAMGQLKSWIINKS